MVMDIPLKRSFLTVGCKGAFGSRAGARIVEHAKLAGGRCGGEAGARSSGVWPNFSPPTKTLPRRRFFPSAVGDGRPRCRRADQWAREQDAWSGGQCVHRFIPLLAACHGRHFPSAPSQLRLLFRALSLPHPLCCTQLSLRPQKSRAQMWRLLLTTSTS